MLLSPRLISARQQQEGVAARTGGEGGKKNGAAGAPGLPQMLFPHCVRVGVMGWTGPSPLMQWRVTPAKGLLGNVVHNCAMKHRPPNGVQAASVVEAAMHGWVWPDQCNAKRVVCTEYLGWVWTGEEEGGSSSGPK